jgi:acyl carrier protein
MGLDGVEIVSEVEDAFGITIQDAEAAKTVTPGQLIDLVLTKVGRGAMTAPDAVNAQPGQWSREHVAEVVRAIVVDQLGCENAYREDAHFVKDLGMA